MQGDKAPENTPAGTLCHPDIIAYGGPQLIVKQPTNHTARLKINPPASLVSTESEYRDWTQLEATGIFESKGKDTEKDLVRAFTYTEHHLLARPDRVVVLGFYIRQTGFYLILTGASGACRTTELSWTNFNHIELLRDFIYRIFKPGSHMVDPTIARNRDGSFDIKLNENHYKGWRLKWLGRAIGRRTTIFFTHIPEVPIIKEQYLRDPCGHEASIINKIHQDGPVPGVIDVHAHQDFQEGDSKVVCSIGEERYKVRLALKGTGAPFMDIQTPYEVLVATYDLLETTRCLYANAGILHRDISKGNVLYRKSVKEKQESDSDSITSDDMLVEKEEAPQEEKPKKLIFCAVQHLLNEGYAFTQDDTNSIDRL